MRSLFCATVVVSLASFCPAGEQETTGNKKDTSASPIVNIEALTGAELFDHQWSHYSPKQRAGADKQQADRLKQRQTAVDADRQQLLRNADILRDPRRLAALRGQSIVGQRTGDGLGPLHNATSCAECHERGGAAGVEHNATLVTIDPRSVAVTDPALFSGKQLFEVFPGLLNELGALNIETVLHDRSAKAGYKEIRDRLVDYVPDGIADAWFDPAQRTSEAIAEQPVIAGRHGTVDFYLSQRNPPPLYGMGLIDAIQPKRLIALVEQQEREGRVSGRLAQKFGWRGQIGTVDQFVSQACAGELGLTHPTAVQPGDPANVLYRPPGFDMSAASVERLADFVTALPAPVERDPADSEADIFKGETVFNNLGCADCHVADVYPAMNVFSDLLLHDMGERLQAPSPAPTANAKTKPMKKTSNYNYKGPISGAAPVYYGSAPGQVFPRPDYIARPQQPQFPRGERKIPTEVSDVMTWDDLQREWRTPPLWGVADTGPYMHDGRAKTLKEAILWHGGEAHASKDLFVALTKEDQSDLVAFLKTLRAPSDADLIEAKDPNGGNIEEGLAPDGSLPLSESEIDVFGNL